MALYPSVEPYDQGMLDVGDGQRLYWNVRGRAGAKPAVILHGGPGSGHSPALGRYFDPARYRVVSFDQRGSGTSTPGAGDPDTDLSVNTTEHLIADIEALRRHLGIERWLVFGGSWGSTLGIAYAERHPSRISELVLWGVAIEPRREIDWLCRGGLAMFLPEAWERFRAGAAAAEGEGDPVAAYHRLLNDADPLARATAAKDWHDWEAALLAAEGVDPPPAWSDPAFRLARARIVTHYFQHDCWLADRALLCGAGALQGIPGVIAQGRLDLQAPPLSAWELDRAWPDGKLVVVASAGHTTADPTVTETLVSATDAFAGR